VKGQYNVDVTFRGMWQSWYASFSKMTSKADLVMLCCWQGKQYLFFCGPRIHQYVNYLRSTAFYFKLFKCVHWCCWNYRCHFHSLMFSLFWQAFTVVSSDTGQIIPAVQCYEDGSCSTWTPFCDGAPKCWWSELSRICSVSWWTGVSRVPHHIPNC